MSNKGGSIEHSSAQNCLSGPGPFSAKKTWRYFRRSARLRCPVCGISPLFPPARRTESITDWFTTLPGCPRCNFVYDREEGYFLFALWLINLGAVTFVGLGLMLLLDYLFALSTAQLMFFTLLPLWALGILTVRHVKAFFLALDHLIHPHLDETDQRPN